VISKSISLGIDSQDTSKFIVGISIRQETYCLESWFHIEKTNGKYCLANRVHLERQRHPGHFKQDFIRIENWIFAAIQFSLFIELERVQCRSIHHSTGGGIGRSIRLICNNACQRPTLSKIDACPTDCKTDDSQTDACSTNDCPTHSRTDACSTDACSVDSTTDDSQTDSVSLSLCLSLSLSLCLSLSLSVCL